MTPLVLASSSRVRAAILAASGIAAATVPANVDEDAVKEGLEAEKAPPRNIADTLAELKALRVSCRMPQALVIGCDQVLDCGGRLFNKPSDRAAARRQLLELKGRTHILHSAVCVAKGGAVIWRHIASPKLTMRAFSDAFLDHYLEEAGDAVTSSVGGYQLEGPGSQLMSRIEGDYFSILGLPLLPLQAFLRDQEVLVP